MFVAIVYQPPNSTVDFFHNAEESTKRLQALSHYVIISGDSNCNMLTCNPLSEKVKDRCSYLYENHKCTWIDLILLMIDTDSIIPDVRALGMSDWSLLSFYHNWNQLKSSSSAHKFRFFRHFKGNLEYWSGVRNLSRDFHLFDFHLKAYYVCIVYMKIIHLKCA